MRNEIEPATEISLRYDHERVIAGAIIRFKEIQVWQHALLVRVIRAIGAGDEWCKQVGAAREAVPAVSVIALFVRKVGADRPVTVDSMLCARGDVDAVRSLVIGIDQIACRGSAALQASSPR